MPTLRQWWMPFAAFALLLGHAHAHDPYQGWTSADLRADGTMVLSLTIGQGAARNLLEPKPEVYFTEDNFADYHAPLKAQAQNLFTITSNGTALAPKTAESILTDEADVTFIITYPRPAPGPLHIKANYLQKMEDGHVDTLEVVEGTRASYGMADLNVEHPALDLNLPATLPATRFAPAPPAASPPQGASSSYAPPPGTPFPVSVGSKPAPTANSSSASVVSPVVSQSTPASPARATATLVAVAPAKPAPVAASMNEAQKPDPVVPFLHSLTAHVILAVVATCILAGIIGYRGKR